MCVRASVRVGICVCVANSGCVGNSLLYGGVKTKCSLSNKGNQEYEIEYEIAINVINI